MAGKAACLALLVPGLSLLEFVTFQQRSTHVTVVHPDVLQDRHFSNMAASSDCALCAGSSTHRFLC